MNHKFGILRTVSLTALVVGLTNIAAQAQTTLHANDIVVYRVGDGTATLASGTAAAVFIDEYNVSGTTPTLVNTVALPTTAVGANLALTASGATTSEGELNVSTNGQYLSLTGYNATPGTTGIVTSTTTQRVVGILGNGAIDTSTSLTGTTFSAGNIRGAYTTDGSNIYAVGSNTGVVNTTKGTSGTGIVVSTTATNLRDVVVSNGQLYISTASGTGAGSFRIGQVGTGTPTTTGNTTTAVPGTYSSGTGSPAAPYAFFFASLSTTNDTLYVADTNSIDKFSLVSGSYVATGAITGVTGVEGLTGSVSGSTVKLYATNSTGIYSATDASGYNASASGAAASIVTAGANQNFRGIAFLPNDIALPEPGVLPLVAEAGALVLGLCLLRRRHKAG